MPKAPAEHLGRQRAEIQAQVIARRILGLALALKSANTNQGALL